MSTSATRGGHNKCSAAAKMGDHARANWAEKWGRGLLCPFPWGELGPHLTHCGLGTAAPFQGGSWSHLTECGLS